MKHINLNHGATQYGETLSTMPFYETILKEFKAGKLNFEKRYTIMVNNTDELFRTGKITYNQYVRLMSNLNYYNNLNKRRKEK